jgi:hypothetical protein
MTNYIHGKRTKYKWQISPEKLKSIKEAAPHGSYTEKTSCQNKVF